MLIYLLFLVGRAKKYYFLEMFGYVNSRI